MVAQNELEWTEDNGVTLHLGAPFCSCMHVAHAETLLELRFSAAKIFGTSPIAYGPCGLLLAFADRSIAFIGRTGVQLGRVVSSLHHPEGPGIPVADLKSNRPHSLAGLLSALAQRDLVIL